MSLRITKKKEMSSLFVPNLINLSETLFYSQPKYPAYTKRQKCQRGFRNFFLNGLKLGIVTVNLNANI